MKEVNSIKHHYDHHLSDFYTWSLGDIQAKQASFQEFLLQNQLAPKSTRLCLDLGAGSGLHSVPLANVGYTVKAIDFSAKLLAEFSELASNLGIEFIEGDIRNIQKYASGLTPELIVCMGDTVTHLENINEVERLIYSCSQLLAEEGKLLLSFRDYSKEVVGKQRFIPVHSDDQRIHTCILKFGKDKVCVTDLLHLRKNFGWKQSVSTYRKIRLDPVYVEEALTSEGLDIRYHDTIEGMVYLLGVKSSN